ncbi:MAG: ABC transporter substrate-binding protein [Spirochaetes bacterium]|nr:ABC transporter substrate-binding protein [Spirochaetota bacterium]
MKNRLTAFVLFLLLTWVFTSCEKQKNGLTITDGILSVGLEIGYPPMEYYDTDGVTLAGFDIELTKALAEKLQLKVKYIDTAWEGIFAGLDTGKYDIAVNITILPQRQRNYNFTKPYIGSSITITSLKDFPNKIKKPEDIEGYRIAYQSNTTAQYFAEKLVRQGIAITSFSYDKIINCFDDLKFGRVDFVIADNIASFYYTKNDNSPFEAVWQGPPDEYIGICLKKGNDALTNALNNELEQLFADGAMPNIFGRDLVSSVLPEFETQ